MSDQHDEMLSETIARHFDRSKVSGDTIDLGVAELFVRCRVSEIRDCGSHQTASLFFELWGGQLGKHPLFASMSGYGASVEEAIIGGGCLWARTFGPVLTTALAEAGNGEPTSNREPTSFDAAVHGRPVRVVVDGLDRSMSFDAAGKANPDRRTQSARELFGAAPWLAPRVIASGTLPMLPVDRATLLSLFASDSKDNRVLEVKVNGQDWPPSQRLLDDVPPSFEPGVALLRELAVIVPQGPPPPLARAVLEHTLAGAQAETVTGPRRMVTWPGWLAHRGRLGRPASDAQLRALESDIGALPAAYRAFIATIAHAGAGPGYGMLSPFTATQAALARGEFSWRDGDAPHGAPGGVLALAHAGCGIMWLLVLTGRHGGEVWVDLRSSDGCVRRVAGTFDEWYRDWVDALVRDAPLYAQWDGARCATASVLVQMLEALQREGLSLEAARQALPARIGKGTTTVRSGDSAYFAQGATLGPCEPCTRVVTDLGISADAFAPGTPPLEGNAPKKPGLLRRIATALRGDDT